MASNGHHLFTMSSFRENVKNPQFKKKWVFCSTPFSSKMVTFPLKRLQNAIFFKERLLALGVSYLKVGLETPIFFFPLFSGSGFFFFFMQADSLVRVAV